MPLSDQDREAVRMSLDPSIPREERARRLDEIYLGPEIVDKPAPPRGRTASSDVNVGLEGSVFEVQESEAPPKREPLIPEGSQVFVGDKPPGAEASTPRSRLSQQPVSDREKIGMALSGVSEEELAAQEEAAEPEQPQPQTVGTQAQGPVVTDQSPTEASVQQFLLDAYTGGSPGRRIPAHDRPVATTVRAQRGPSPESEEEVEKRTTDAALGAVTRGGVQAAGLEEEAKDWEQQAQELDKERSQFVIEQAAAKTEYEIAQSEYDDMQEEVRNNPPSIWSGEGEQDVLKGIGMILLGIGAGPEHLHKVMQDELDRKERQRGKELSLVERKLGRLKERVMNPQAAEAMERSLLKESMAAELQAAANMASAEDARQRGYAAAQQLLLSAAQDKRAASAAMAGDYATKIQHVPSQVVGGRQGGLPALIAAGEKLGLSGVEAVKAAQEGRLPTQGMKPEELNAARAQLEHRQERQVALPSDIASQTGTQFAFATTKERADKIQARIDDVSQYERNMRRMKEILSVTGSSMSPELRAEYNTLATSNKNLMKGIEELGAITEADQDLVQPLTGEGGEEFTTLKSRTLKSIDTAVEHTAGRKEAAMRGLYKSPETSELITSTGAQLGFQPE